MSTVRGVMISDTRMSSSMSAFVMILDSLLERVPCFAPSSAKRIISSSERWSLGGLPTKGRIIKWQM